MFNFLLFCSDFSVRPRFPISTASLSPLADENFSSQQLNQHTSDFLCALHSSALVVTLPHAVKNLDRSQRLVQVGQQIVHVLNAHRNSYHAVGQPNLLSSLFSQGGMRHGGRM